MGASKVRNMGKRPHTEQECMMAFHAPIKAGSTLIAYYRGAEEILRKNPAKGRPFRTERDCFLAYYSPSSPSHSSPMGA